MSTRSPVPTPTSAATPAALASAAPSSTARAVYLHQKRTFAAHRGAELYGGGLAVPRITYADALALVGWWSRDVPALAACLEVGDCDPDVAAWARCALTVRAVATGPAAVGAGAAPYPDRVRLWNCIKRIATAMDSHQVTPRNASRVELEKQIAAFMERLRAADAAAKRAGDSVKARAGDAAQAIGDVSDALAGGAAKVSAAAGRGAGEGAIRGALSAAKVPAAIAGVALVGGLAVWVASRAGNDNRAARASTAAAKPRKKTGGRR
jgi:hypothetical protein